MPTPRELGQSIGAQIAAMQDEAIGQAQKPAQGQEVAPAASAPAIQVNVPEQPVVVNVTVPEQPAPVVQITTPEIQAPAVEVKVEAPPAANVNVEAPVITVQIDMTPVADALKPIGEALKALAAAIASGHADAANTKALIEAQTTAIESLAAAQFAPREVSLVTNSDGLPIGAKSTPKPH